MAVSGTKRRSLVTTMIMGVLATALAAAGLPIAQGVMQASASNACLPTGVSGGAAFTLASGNDGSVYTWGQNNSGDLGIGQPIDSYVSSYPTKIAGVTTTTGPLVQMQMPIAAGVYHALVVSTGGTVWAWGNNDYGQLGDGTTTTRRTPVQVSGLSGVIAVAAGAFHSLALKADGSVWGWGYNAAGQLGNGTTTDSHVPVQVSGLSNVVNIAGGFENSLAAKVDGTVWAWGYGQAGAMGNGTSIFANTTPVQASISGVSTVWAGSSFQGSMAIKKDGTAWAWGNNSNGQLGNGTTNNAFTPVQVSRLSSLQWMSGGQGFALATKTDGTVWGWGLNANGQLGNGTTTSTTVPGQVQGLSGFIGNSVIATGVDFSLGLRYDNNLWGWGQGSAGELGNGGNASVNTTPAPTAYCDFSISASPTSLSIGQGGTGTVNISTALTTGESQTVILTSSGAPTGVTATFSPNQVTPGQSSVLTFNVASSTIPGTYPVTVTGNGAYASHSVTVTLTVTGNDFSMSASPTSLTIDQGQSGTSTISTAVTSGGAQTISLSLSGVPSGVTRTLNPSSVSAGQSSTLTLSASNTAPGGSYTITVTGTGPNTTHTATVALTVIGNDFSMSASPTSLTIDQGQGGTSTISTAVTSGAAQAISLSLSGVPSGVTGTLNPSSVSAGQSSTLTLSASNTAAAGSYTVTVTGTGTNATHTTTVTLTVVANDFSISASPSSLSLGQGSSGSVSVQTQSVSGAAQSITLSASGLPSGASATFAANPITAGQSTSMSISVATTTPTGSYTVTITSAAASATHSTTVTLSVAANDFSMTASPTSLSLNQGQSGTSTISTSLTSGSSQSLTLSAGGVPSGVTASFSANPINTGQSSVLTLSTTATTPPGSYTVTVTATDAFVTHSVSISLTVVANDFSLAASPSTLTVSQGFSGATTISTTLTSGSVQSVNLSIGGLPAGVSASFSRNPISSWDQTSLHLTVASSTAPGSYTLTVTATGPSATHSTSVTLNVVTNDFAIAANPSQLSINQGQSGTASIATSITSGQPQSVALSVAGLPSGATAAFDANPITSSQSSNLTVSVAPSTTPGTYALTVTGVGTYATHSTTLTLVVAQLPSNSCAAGTAVVDGYVSDTYLRLRELQPDAQTLLVCVRVQNVTENLGAGGLLTVRVPSGLGRLPSVDSQSGACASTPGDGDQILLNPSVGPVDPSQPETALSFTLEQAHAPLTNDTWVCVNLVSPAGGASPGVALGRRVVIPGLSGLPQVVTFTQDPSGLYDAPAPAWPVSGPDVPSSQCQNAPHSSKLLALTNAGAGEWLYTMQPDTSTVDVCVRVQVGSTGAGALLTLDTFIPGQPIVFGNAAGGSATCPVPVVSNGAPEQFAIWRSATGVVPASVCFQVAGGSWISLTAPSGGIPVGIRLDMR